MWIRSVIDCDEGVKVITGTQPINQIFRISIKQQEDPQRSTLNLLDGSMVETITSKILPTNSIVPSIGEGIIEWAVSSKNHGHVHAFGV